VPTTWPVPVRGTLEADQAIPKSVILTTPSLRTSTLPGLMSRWITPAACAAASAAEVCRTTSRVRDGLSRPSRSSSAESVSPSTSSITR
jgi:hypothetical protein